MLPPVPLHESPSDGSEEATLEEAIPAAYRLAEDPEWAIERVWLAELLAGLDARRREVVRRYFWGGESLGEIAEALGISVSRVQQLRRQAQEQLRAAMMAEGTHGYQ